MVVNVNSEAPTTPVSEFNAVDHVLTIDKFLPRHVWFVGFRACTNGENELIAV